MPLVLNLNRFRMMPLVLNLSRLHVERLMGLIGYFSAESQ